MSVRTDITENICMDQTLFQALMTLVVCIAFVMKRVLSDGTELHIEFRCAKPNPRCSISLTTYEIPLTAIFSFFPVHVNWACPREAWEKERRKRGKERRRREERGEKSAEGGG